MRILSVRMVPPIDFFQENLTNDTPNHCPRRRCCAPCAMRWHRPVKQPARPRLKSSLKCNTLKMGCCIHACQRFLLLYRWKTPVSWPRVLSCRVPHHRDTTTAHAQRPLTFAPWQAVRYFKQHKRLWIRHERSWFPPVLSAWGVAFQIVAYFAGVTLSHLKKRPP